MDDPKEPPLAANEKFPRPPLRYKRFGGGYRREDVEFALAELRLTLRQLDNDLEALRDRARDLEAELRSARGEVESYRQREAELTRTMADALRRADDIEAQAQESARAIVANAEEAALRARADAHRRIEETGTQFNELLRMKDNLLETMRGVVGDFEHAIARVERGESLFAGQVAQQPVAAPPVTSEPPVTPLPPVDVPPPAARTARIEFQPVAEPLVDLPPTPLPEPVATHAPEPELESPPAAVQSVAEQPPAIVEPLVQEPPPLVEPLVQDLPPLVEPVAEQPPAIVEAVAVQPHAPEPVAEQPVAHLQEEEPEQAAAPPPLPHYVEPAAAAPRARTPSPQDEQLFETRVELDAGPFSDFASLSAFERALAQLPMVDDVYVRRLAEDRALIELTLSEPSPLLAAMHGSLPYGLEVRSANRSKLVVNVHAESTAGTR